MLIGYARVSTDRQTDRAQMDALKAAGCVRVFTETASGRDDRRPELAKALDHVRAGDTLCAYKLDRLARSARKLLDIRDALQAKGAHLRLLDGAIAGDTATPAGAMLFTVLAAMAEFEAAIIRERTLEGLKAARARGKRGGRKPVDPEKVKAAQAMLAGGMSGAAAAKAAGISRATLYRHREAPPVSTNVEVAAAPPEAEAQERGEGALREIMAREAAANA